MVSARWSGWRNGFLSERELIMKILVAAADYPSENSVALMYVHVRNRYYAENGISVSVLNFSAKQPYLFDGIRVLSLAAYENSQESYDILVCHAPNIRNHYRFLKKYQRAFSKIVFFFHGHEVVRINECYPAPYPYMGGKSFFSRLFQSCYDTFKLFLWRRYLPKLAEKARFVFVSRNFFEKFQKYTGLSEAKLLGHTMVIHNSVGAVFERECYDRLAPKEFDFITIRPYMDRSNYSMDIVCSLAKANPSCRFLAVGTGRFFEHYEQPENLIWHNGTLSHEDIPVYLNRSRCALIPTRTDTQGVMTCEAATFGIPTITSDLAVCHEICDTFSNVGFLDNAFPSVDLLPLLAALEQKPFVKSDRYFKENTVRCEIEMLHALYAEDGKEKPL